MRVGRNGYSHTYRVSLGGRQSDHTRTNQIGYKPIRSDIQADKVIIKEEIRLYPVRLQVRFYQIKVNTVIIHYPSKKCYPFRINFIRKNSLLSGQKYFPPSRFYSIICKHIRCYVTKENLKRKSVDLQYNTVRSEQEQNLLVQPKTFYEITCSCRTCCLSSQSF
jgi:hypothetical protein